MFSATKRYLKRVANADPHDYKYMTETKNIKISLDNPNSRHQFGWTGQDII